MKIISTLKSCHSKRGLVPLLILFLLYIPQTATGQPENKKQFHAEDFTFKELLFRGKHIGLTLTPMVISKAIITKNIDKYDIKSLPQLGFEASLKKYLNFDTSNSLILGFVFGAYGRNLDYLIPKEEFNFAPPWDIDISSNTAASREYDFIIGIPILFQKRWFTKDRRFWNSEAGFTIRYTPNIIETQEHIFFGQFFNMEFITNPKNKIWLTYNLGAGRSFILKNKNIVSVGVEGNLSFTTFAESKKYQFTVPNKPVVEGTYKVKGSYVGLSLSYILTKYKKSLRKIDGK
jgi:hypothetical protein